MKFMGIVIVIILLVLSTAGCVSDDELKELEDENAELEKENARLEDEKKEFGEELFELYQNYIKLTADIENLNDTFNNCIPPKVVIFPSTMRGPAPLEVDFYSFSNEAAVNDCLWIWNFSDGNYSDETKPTHNFVTPGGYIVALEVRNEYNFSCFASVIITVEDKQPEKVVLSGGGDSVSDTFYLSEGIISFEMKHDGEHHYAIWLFNLDIDEREDLLANTAGNYEGKTLVEIDDDGYSDGKSGYHILDISADGDWEVTIEHL